MLYTCASPLRALAVRPFSRELALVRVAEQRNAWLSTSARMRLKTPPNDEDPPIKREVALEVAMQMSHEKVRTVAEFVTGEQIEVERSMVVEGDTSREVGEISGVPKAHREERMVRIYQPPRTATQTAWGNTGVWKIELDNRERWENPNMGWASSADPLSNISMAMDFASSEDAIRFCEKNHWNYEVEEGRQRKIVPKAYGVNFSWNKKTRVSTK